MLDHLGVDPIPKDMTSQSPCLNAFKNPSFSLAISGSNLEN